MPTAMAAVRMQSPTNGWKRPSQNIPHDSGPPQRGRKALLDDDESTNEDSESSDHVWGGPANEIGGSSKDESFKVNEEYARRFEHNKKREELGRLQDKYGPLAVPMPKGSQAQAAGGGEDDLLESSSDEDEDDDGVLALGALDEQVQSTLEAIRKKDPRVYDASVKFYNDPEEEAEEITETKAKQEKPLYLSDYHRKNLLEGCTEADNNEEILPSYQQQQADLKDSIVKEIHATADDPDGEENSDGDDEDDFLTKKAVKAQDQINSTDTQPRRVMLNVESADKDPETYLANFMSAKGWVTNGSSMFQPFESDDEEEDRRAEAFEEAYNLRFEDPKAANEKLMSHARDTAARYSVRKEETNPRKRKRDIERTRKDAEKQLRSAEKARMRTLKVAELEEKVQKIKDAAGMKSENLAEEDWSEFLNDAWDDDRWEQEMKKRFGDEYYDKQDVDGEGDGEGLRKRKIKKPKWNDDIDIKDLVPDFDDEAEDQNPPFELSDEAVEAGDTSHKSKDKKSKLKAEQIRKKALRLERRKIEQLVDKRLDVDETLANFGKKHAGFFRYRETSPMTHGLTAHDILMADDSQLNQFAGLKKLAAFRDPDKKRRDKKHLGKKQRLKQWRKETFGSEQGPTKTFAEVVAFQASRDASLFTSRVGADSIREGGRKKKRSSEANALKEAT